MTLFVLILLIIVQVISAIALFGFGLQASSLRLPLIGLTALVSIIDSVIFAAQFWWLFGVWYQSFVLGSVVISVGGLIIGLVAQISTNSIGREKNIRVNVSSMLLFGRGNVFLQILSAAALIAMLFVLFKTYAMSRGQVTEDTIKSATILFFTIGSLPFLIVSAIQTASNALKPSLDPLARNVFAIGSLSGYGLAAWRAAFPFYLFGGTAVAMGYQLSLSTVLTAMAITYTVFVIVPLLLGELRYTQERNSVITETCGLLEDLTHLSDPVLRKSVFEEERSRLSQQLNQMLTNLYENDSLLRFLAFWRWGPDSAFHREGNYWVLHGPASSSNNSKLIQPLGVLDRPWFQHLIGPKKRVLRQFNASTMETLAGAHLGEIPNWNYRAAIFNDLVMVLEDLDSNDPTAACDRAGIARNRIARERRQARRSIVTAAFLAAYAFIGSTVGSVFKDEIEGALRSALKLIGGA
jgi:hypothetical protein